MYRITKNIINELYVDPLVTKKDQIEIFDNALIKIDNYMNKNILDYSDEGFHENLEEGIIDMLCLEFEHIMSYALSLSIQCLVKEALKIYFLIIVPERSYTHLCRPLSDIKVNMLKAKIEHLRNIPQPEQRSKEWYHFRHNLITASSAWKVFGTKSTINNLIYEKCQPIQEYSQGGVNTDSPLHWGQKYEPISVLIYEELFDTKVEDFGCIKDEIYGFLGASPDGINVDDRSHLYGRMLEIKNIVNREITGIPKKEYWIQMQLQMSVCKLNECDFLETQFIEYDSHENFMEDSLEGNVLLTKNNLKKGLFLSFSDKNTPKYIYPPNGLCYKELELWEEKEIQTNKLVWVRTIYWKLEKISCVLVCRNNMWFESAIKEIENVWKTIEYERINGYEHRAPNRKRKEEPKKTGCLLNIKVTKLN